LQEPDSQEEMKSPEKLVVMLKEFKVKPLELAIAIRKAMMRGGVDYAKLGTEETIVWGFNNKGEVEEYAVEKEPILPGEEPCQEEG
jgi:hypothetical protein